MEKLKVFHGSDHEIKNPVYLGGKAGNDYGNGFYTTEYEDRARSWAVLNGNQDRAVVNCYELNVHPLKILDLNDWGVLAWIAEVVANRGTEQANADIIGKRLVELYRQDTGEFDVIKGYRADDSYTQVIEAFLLNQLNISEVERLFYKGSLGHQVFLKSSKAFENIEWTGSYHAEMEESDKDADIYARREVNRFLAARTSAILLEGYEVPGITARFAIQNHLTYQKEGKYYEHTGIR